jgi:hypothetical protein
VFGGWFRGELASLPKRLRASPEDRDKAEAEVKQEGMVKGQDKSALSLATLQKTVRLADFAPKITTLFERGEIDDVAGEFKKYLESQWEDERYLRLEK